ncbi:hypothetical protein [Oceanobacillus salinisoli]|uniref:hypothetical protein n=1 Tax=Oceanobacillus salinisoli TaxID=2678611 RepID=UPI0012E1F01B|nr:hypothetical protein [Oceanobacillus salinisoli]
MCWRKRRGLQLNIYRTGGGQLFKTSSISSTLNQGQIIKGQVAKLYPENKALIQLNNQTLIAKLEAPLVIGGKYHFQVQLKNNVLYLKVIGEKLKNQSKLDASVLLQHLGLKANQANRVFVQQLMREGVPFEQHQLASAIPLLHQHKNDEKVQDVLKELINRNLPITERLFQAFLSYKTSNQSELMWNLLNQLEQNGDDNPLYDHLRNTVAPALSEKEALVKHIMSDIGRNSQQFFQILKTSQLVDSNVDFNEWKSQWEVFSQSNKHSMPLPFRLDSGDMRELLETMSKNRGLLLEQAEPLLQNWGVKLQTAINRNESLNHNDFISFKKQLSTLIEMLNQNKEMKINNHPSSLHEAFRLLQTLSTDEVYKVIQSRLASIKHDHGFINMGPKDQLLQQFNQFFTVTGLDYEYRIHHQMEQEQTIKGLLLQLIANNDGSYHDHAAKLLHFMNGMQLNTVTEMDNFVHANFQIPGERLGLKSDLNLEMESRKTKDGEISPDFCRIYFYLELANLKETMIDMNIQQRNVTLTIYNNTESLKNQTLSLQPLLKSGLEKLNYHLTAISFKPIPSETNNDYPLKDKKLFQSSYQGVDYRI